MKEVSVIMPVYNQERYVGDAVRSILRQTFRELELIIVDDGSTDGTVAVVEGFRDDRIRLLRTEHKGFLHALKTATAEARGRWLARMDSDDVSRADRLERQVGFLKDHPECVFVSSAYGIATPNDRFLAPAGGDGWQYVEAKDITRATRLFCDPATVYDREAALRAGYDDRWENEKPLWYRLLGLGRGALMDEPLYFARWLLGSHSRRKVSHLAQVDREIRLAYDPENIAGENGNGRPKLNLKNEKRCVYFNAAAGDFSAARDVAFRTLRRHPATVDALKLVLISCGVRTPKTVEGPCGVKFSPVERPVWS